MRDDLKLEGVFLDNLRDVLKGKMKYKLSDVGSGKLFKKQSTPRAATSKPVAQYNPTFTNPAIKKSALLNPVVPKTMVKPPPVANPSTIKPPLRAPSNTLSSKPTDVNPPLRLVNNVPAAKPSAAKPPSRPTNATVTNPSLVNSPLKPANTTSSQPGDIFTKFKPPTPEVTNQAAIKLPVGARNNANKTNSNRFAALDLTTPKGVEVYSKICQSFINGRNPNAGITGNMMASSAVKTFQSTGRYVPPELALAQLAIEGGLNTNPNAIPVRTNNPYNVGNWDNGKKTQFTNKQIGIDKYYDVIARSYLTNNRTAEDILQNFTDVRGNRYASAENYEQMINKIVNQISSMKQSMSMS
jgi:hypothetical protein